MGGNCVKVMDHGRWQVELDGGTLCNIRVDNLELLSDAEVEARRKRREEEEKAQKAKELAEADNAMLTASRALMSQQQRAGKRTIQVFGANATGKGTRFQYLVDEEKRRLGDEQWEHWTCAALGGRNFGVLFLPTGLLVFGFPSKTGRW